jgi:hypothetical protein
VIRRTRTTKTNIYSDRPGYPVRVEAIEYMHKALQFAQHQEGTTERDLHDIERIAQLFSRLQIDGKKQRKVDDYFKLVVTRLGLAQ